MCTLSLCSIMMKVMCLLPGPVPTYMLLHCCIPQCCQCIHPMGRGPCYPLVWPRLLGGKWIRTCPDFVPSTLGEPPVTSAQREIWVLCLVHVFGSFNICPQILWYSCFQDVEFQCGLDWMTFYFSFLRLYPFLVFLFNCHIKLCLSCITWCFETYEHIVEGQNKVKLCMLYLT
jgi:hypothetical protein